MGLINARTNLDLSRTKPIDPSAKVAVTVTSLQGERTDVCCLYLFGVQGDLAYYDPRVVSELHRARKAVGSGRVKSALFAINSQLSKPREPQSMFIGPEDDLSPILEALEKGRSVELLRREGANSLPMML